MGVTSLDWPRHREVTGAFSWVGGIEGAGVRETNHTAEVPQYEPRTFVHPKTGQPSWGFGADGAETLVSSGSEFRCNLRRKCRDLASACDIEAFRHIAGFVGNCAPPRRASGARRPPPNGGCTRGASVCEPEDRTSFSRVVRCRALRPLHLDPGAEQGCLRTRGQVQSDGGSAPLLHSGGPDGGRLLHRWAAVPRPVDNCPAVRMASRRLVIAQPTTKASLR